MTSQNTRQRLCTNPDPDACPSPTKASHEAAVSMDAKVALLRDAGSPHLILGEGVAVRPCYGRPGPGREGSGAFERRTGRSSTEDGGGSRPANFQLLEQVVPGAWSGRMSAVGRRGRRNPSAHVTRPVAPCFCFFAKGSRRSGRVRSGRIRSSREG